MEQQRSLVQRGWQLHQQRQFVEAEALYRQALEQGPPSAVASYCYGKLALDMGQCEVARMHLAAAVSLDDGQATYHADLAQALQALQRFPEAVASYRHAIEREPNRADIHVNLANTLLQSGNSAAALASYRRAIELAPAMADAHNGLGAALEQQQQPDDALHAYRHAAELRPNYGLAHYNLGTLLSRQKRAAEALVELERAVALLPNFASARHNLGVALNLLRRPAEAQTCFEQAIAQDPRPATFHFNLGDVLEQQGRLDEALVEYTRALELDPNYLQARMSRGTLLLKLGRFHEGFADYEARVGLPQYDTLALPQPAWDGTPLVGQTLLIHGEQGLGDALQFIRYVTLAKKRVPNVVVAVRPELIPLLSASGYGPVVSIREPLPACDVQAALVSLPRIFGTTMEQVPADVPYLASDGRLRAEWKSRLAEFTGFRVGIHWQGNPAYAYDDLRSIPLVAFEPLARVPGVRLFVLQKKDGRDQLADARRRFDFVDLGEELDNEHGLFMDTAAVIDNLDLVVTSDTSVAHLAGGLAADVWVALAYAAEWRWLVDRDDSPWYPSMRLFRQSRAGDWSGVFARMATELAALVKHSGA